MPRSFKSVSVILPTYNEKGNIGSLLKAISDQMKKEHIDDYQIIVVDDDSRDGTREVVTSFQAENPKIELYVRKGARGLATAVRYGIDRSSKEILMLMDSDYNHDPADLPGFFSSLDAGYDVVVGSRYIKGGFMESSVLRHYLSMCFNIFVQSMLNIHTKDNLSGFLAIRRTALESIDLDAVFVGFGEFHIPLIYQLQKKRSRIMEIPVIYGERQYGRSKFHPIKNIINYTKLTLKIRAKWGRCSS